jgi:hypothetical protein
MKRSVAYQVLKAAEIEEQDVKMHDDVRPSGLVQDDEGYSLSFKVLSGLIASVGRACIESYDADALIAALAGVQQSTHGDRHLIY